MRPLQSPGSGLPPWVGPAAVLHKVAQAAHRSSTQPLQPAGRAWTQRVGRNCAAGGGGRCGSGRSRGDLAPARRRGAAGARGRCESRREGRTPPPRPPSPRPSAMPPAAPSRSSGRPRFPAALSPALGAFVRALRPAPFGSGPAPAGDWPSCTGGRAPRRRRGICRGGACALSHLLSSWSVRARAGPAVPCSVRPADCRLPLARLP